MNCHKTSGSQCKTKVVHKLQWHNPCKRINFCNWAFHPLYDGKINTSDFLLKEVLFHVHCEAYWQKGEWNSH